MKPHKPELNINEAGRTNGDRAQSGRIAVRAYWRTRQDARESTTQDASDLIADVLHYCHADGGDPLVAHRNGLKDFAQEIELARPFEMPARVVIVVEQGNVENVLSNVPVEFVKLDLDTEGSEPEDTHEIADPRWSEEQSWREQKTRAFVSIADTEIEPEAVLHTFREANAAVGVPGELQEAGRVTLPRLTHAEIVDFFPILEGVRAGFVGDKLIDHADFLAACRERGGGAMAASQIIFSVIFDFAVSLKLQIGRMDSAHKLGVAQLLEAFTTRGL